MSGMDYGELVKKINALRIGQTVFVETETERQQATQIARAQDKIVTTKKRKNSEGFTVTRLPE